MTKRRRISSGFGYSDRYIGETAAMWIGATFTILIALAIIKAIVLAVV